ncbi:MAG TPA: thioredoxin [Clostridiaceae bacterium]|nr:thioredoxin [Clostridiaceae bacterium]
MNLKSNKLYLRIIRYVLLILIVISIVYGILRGEVQIVLRNAVNICLDCIGIG